MSHRNPASIACTRAAPSQHAIGNLRELCNGNTNPPVTADSETDCCLSSVTGPQMFKCLTAFIHRLRAAAHIPLRADRACHRSCRNHNMLTCRLCSHRTCMRCRHDAHRYPPHTSLLPMETTCESYTIKISIQQHAKGLQAHCVAVGTPPRMSLASASK